MNFLLFFNKSIVLCDTAQCEFVHEVDLIGAVHILDRESLNRSREGSAEEHDLPILRMELQELFDNGCKFGRKKLISFVHDEHGAFTEVSDALASKI